jgi:hypothetical protein
MYFKLIIDELRKKLWFWFMLQKKKSWNRGSKLKCFRRNPNFRRKSFRASVFSAECQSQIFRVSFSSKLTWKQIVQNEKKILLKPGNSVLGIMVNGICWCRVFLSDIWLGIVSRPIVSGMHLLKLLIDSANSSADSGIGNPQEVGYTALSGIGQVLS